MPPHELAIAREHAAEILRPWPVHRCIEDDATDFLRAQFLRLRRKAEERVDITVDNKSFGLAAGSAIHCISFLGSSPTSAAIKVNNRSGPVPNPGTPTVFPFRPAMPWTSSRPNNTKQPTCTPASNVHACRLSRSRMKFEA